MIYLDYHATTPLLPEVRDAMMPFLNDDFGNPASQHAWGWKANLAVNKARAQVSKLLNCEARQILFTSGATESIHLAVLGWLLAQETPSECQVLTSEIEHKATLGASRIAQKMGAQFHLIPVDSRGHINLSALQSRLDQNKKTFVSLIHGHNEIGTINDIESLSEKFASLPHVTFHVDAAQSLGKIPVNLSELRGVDLLSLSGHKMYGPKGVGALFVREARSLHSLFSGGGQEFNLRAGTLNVPGIVGLGRACQWALEHSERESARLKSLRELFFQLIAESPFTINGDRERRLPHNINLTLKNVSMDRLQILMEDVAFSSGSACSSDSDAVNHVHQGLGLSADDSAHTIRFGLGLHTTEKDIRTLADKLIQLTR